VTYSSSRKELVTLLFEAAGKSVPDWATADYTGYPLVIDGERRCAVQIVAYLGFPLAYVLAGLWSTRTIKRRA
jgi:hypothetical protein